MHSIPSVNKRAPGKIPTTAVTNELAEAVMALYPTPVNGQVQVPIARADYFLANIVTEGPNGESDYDDERYFVRRAFIDGTDIVTDDPADPTSPISSSYENDSNDEPQIVTATNLAEAEPNDPVGGVYTPGTHNLEEGTQVFVFYLTDDADENGQNTRYFFIHGGTARMPKPQYQGQFYGGAVANEAAFIYPFAVAAITV